MASWRCAYFSQQPARSQEKEEGSVFAERGPFCYRGRLGAERKEHTHDGSTTLKMFSGLHTHM